MQMKSKKKPMSFVLCMILTAAISFIAVGCNTDTENKTPAAATENINGSSDITVLGEGSTSFAFTVIDQDGVSTQFEIRTDKETVGEALLEVGLIAGDESEYGLYVKTVNDITVDYDTDGKYWAFYIDGEYATTGVDSTPITTDSAYSFKVE